MLIKICNVLGLSADFVLFGEERNTDALLLEKINRIGEKNLPLPNKVIDEILAINNA